VVATARAGDQAAFAGLVERYRPELQVHCYRMLGSWEAALLEVSVAAVKSALQRARPALKQHLPQRRLEWAPSSDPTAEERALLQRYMDAMERADPDALAELLREDARMTMPLPRFWYEGREAIMTLMAGVLEPGSPDYQGHMRVVPTRGHRRDAGGDDAEPAAVAGRVGERGGVPGLRPGQRHDRDPRQHRLRRIPRLGGRACGRPRPSVKNPQREPGWARAERH